MRLIVPTPPEWRRQPFGRSTVLSSPDGDLTVIVTVLFPAPTSASDWLRETLSRTPPWSDPVTEGETSSGWPYSLLEITGEQPRLAACIRVADLAGGIVAHCRNARRRPTWRREILALIEAARPELSDEGATCLAEQVLPN